VQEKHVTLASSNPVLQTQKSDGSHEQYLMVFSLPNVWLLRFD